MARTSDTKIQLASIQKTLKQLENRISRLESAIHKGQTHETTDAQPLLPENIEAVADNLEFQIGQYWFAKAGIMVLAIGIAFLLTFPYKDLPPYLPSVIGFTIVGLLFTSSHLLRKSVVFLSRYLLGGALILLFFSTLRFHFFSPDPVISNKQIFLTLLVLNVIISGAVAIGRSSAYLSALAITLGFITAIVSEKAFFIFFILAALAGSSVYYSVKRNWMGLLLYATFGVYFSHLVWFLNNPVMGNKIQLLRAPQLNILFVLIYFIIFSLGILRRKDISSENNYVILNTFLNCLLGYGIFLLISVTSLRDYIFITHLNASIIFLGISVLFWVSEKSKYSTFFYSLLGYTALSVAILYYFKIPDSLVWLCWQSLLVISTALWFRSKIIVFANFLIYLVIFMSYLIFAGDIGISSLSFGIVALLSARIMNWQKDRLELKTEMMRNLYLFCAFFTIPYALYFNIPMGYIALSWMTVAVFYYLISIALKNKKYRWMALSTIVLTVIYILIVGIAQLEPVYRILSFIIIGLVLLITSIIYTRIRAGNENKNPEKTD